MSSKYKADLFFIHIIIRDTELLSCTTHTRDRRSPQLQVFAFTKSCDFNVPRGGGGYSKILSLMRWLGLRPSINGLVTYGNTKLCRRPGGGGGGGGVLSIFSTYFNLGSGPASTLHPPKISGISSTPKYI